MDTPVAPPTVFVLDELGPVLIRGVSVELRRCRNGRSPHLSGQPVTVGNKQLKGKDSESELLAFTCKFTCLSLTSGSAPSPESVVQSRPCCPVLDCVSLTAWFPGLDVDLGTYRSSRLFSHFQTSPDGNKRVLEVSHTSTVWAEDHQQVDGSPVRIGRTTVTTQFVVRVLPHTRNHMAAGQRAANG